jgi:hypothetical protein
LIRRTPPHTAVDAAIVMMPSNHNSIQKSEAHSPCIIFFPGCREPLISPLPSMISHFGVRPITSNLVGTSRAPHRHSYPLVLDSYHRARGGKKKHKRRRRKTGGQLRGCSHWLHFMVNIGRWMFWDVSDAALHADQLDSDSASPSACAGAVGLCPPSGDRQ